MKLLIDMGNTRIKLSWMAPGCTERVPDVAAFMHGDQAGLARWLLSLPCQPALILGVSVAHAAAMRAFEHTLLAAWPNLQTGVGKPQPLVHWQTSQARAGGVQNNYALPEQLGADRWAALLGVAWHERRRSADDDRVVALLASFGTATTIDTLLPHRASAPGDGYVFPGGVILPGVNLMRMSLANGTAQLSDTPGKVVAYPTQTMDAIASGIAAAQVGAVQRQRQQALRHNKTLPPRLYVTGGAWPQVESEMRGQGLEPTCYLVAPVLDGLACLASTWPDGY